MCFYQGEVSVQKAKLVALEACESLANVASDPSKVRLVAVECQNLLVRHNPWTLDWEPRQFNPSFQWNCY